MLAHEQGTISDQCCAVYDEGKKLETELVTALIRIEELEKQISKYIEQDKYNKGPVGWKS
jgi:hypothetical protein